MFSILFVDALDISPIRIKCRSTLQNIEKAVTSKAMLSSKIKVKFRNNTGSNFHITNLPKRACTLELDRERIYISSIGIVTKLNIISASIETSGSESSGSSTMASFPQHTTDPRYR